MESSKERGLAAGILLEGQVLPHIKHNNKLSSPNKIPNARGTIQGIVMKQCSRVNVSVGKAHKHISRIVEAFCAFFAGWVEVSD